MQSPLIHRVTTLDLAVEPFAWPFAAERRGAIDAHFAKAQRARPGIWNGRILLGRNPVFEDGHFGASYFETDFASFLSWRDWGFPDPGVFNGFGMGALLANDGAFALGVMSEHTANAGRVYFPAGTPDLDDVSDGRLDIEGSVVREIFEETGLTSTDFQADPGWYCVYTGPAAALIRILRVDMSGAALRDKMLANLAAQCEPELAGIHLVRSIGDLTDTMPHFVTAFLKAQLSA